MFENIWLIPFLPLLAFLFLVFYGGRISRTVASWIGCGFLGVSAILSIIAVFAFINPPVSDPIKYVETTIGTWMEVGAFQANFGFRVDALSLLMTLVVTVVGTLIFIFSTEYMAEDRDYSRFFAYMNLFAFSMLVLVLADNLLFLILGWEGVGLCSYLLIGFWYNNPENGYAARKAFITTRIGAIGLILASLALFQTTGTLHLQSIFDTIVPDGGSPLWQVDSTIAVCVTAMLLLAAIGKSAQLPLQVWLPDAMAGPTPTSALIHAATMVTAGVYLIARTHPLFQLAPSIMMTVAIIGTATMLISGTTALVQRDIKRVLAYSTISQIGYMFMALGAGAFTAAMFHFYTHAIFKALLFLSAGAIITAQHHKQDMFEMGGLRKLLPSVYWPFLLGAASLAAIPFITSGFYSKDLILWKAYELESGHHFIVIAGFIGAFITAVYTFRMVFITFNGPSKTEISHKPGLPMVGVLTVLAILSVVAGFIEIPKHLGGIHAFSGFLGNVIRDSEPRAGISHTTEILFQGIATALVAIAILIAWKQYGKGATEAPILGGTGRFLYRGWNFDGLYKVMILNPYAAFCRFNHFDVIDMAYRFFGLLFRLLNILLSKTQDGLLRHYAFGIGFGAILLLLLFIF